MQKRHHIIIGIHSNSRAHIHTVIPFLYVAYQLKKIKNCFTDTMSAALLAFLIKPDPIMSTVPRAPADLELYQVQE